MRCTATLPRPTRNTVVAIDADHRQIMSLIERDAPRTVINYMLARAGLTRADVEIDLRRPVVLVW